VSRPERNNVPGSSPVNRPSCTISVAIVMTALLLLTLTETHTFLPLAFETVSAYGTVGLSTGITPGLSATGKLIGLVM